GVPEDPVTGSAHSMLIPWWGEKLGKTTMMARQISARGVDGSVGQWARGRRSEPPGRVLFAWEMAPRWRPEKDVAKT
ncbi:PhzF family phenazine biosynthesis protein, partial [Mycobacterium tuberculosis]|nr:PhzF family phenazine biosynthesis protein [Mycobacterium tuberculosis]